jgi:ketosteroid isomerase-like protein
MNKETHIEHLIKLVRKEKVSLFIGAGFSLEAEAPSAWNLQQAILAELPSNDLKKEHANDDLDVISQFFVEEICEGSRAELMELLQKQFEFEPKCMDDHLALAAIPHFHNILTTNYDTLLEDSYPQDERVVVKKDEDCAYIDQKPVMIFKIHGDFTNRDFIVITTQDYADLKKQKHNNLVWNEVKSIFTKTHVAFIGYSLSDENVINMIKFISKIVNRNQKQMFLIAPGLNATKKQQLKKNLVSYIDATAKEFLTKLKTEIDENIGPDYRHHDVSDPTFTKYCELHGFDPVVKRTEQKKKENDIVNFKPLEGKNVQHTVNFTVKNQPMDKVQRFDFEKYGSFIKDKNLPFPDVPYIRFAGEDLTSGKHMVNGLVMTRGFREILVAPAIKNIDLTIKIPDRNFVEKVKAQGYRLNDTKFVIQFDCHIYTVKIIFTHSSDLTKGFLLTFSFDEKTTYTDNSLAIKWIDFLCAFFNKEDFYIKEISSNVFNVNSQHPGEIKHNFNDYKKYYELIRQIEIDGDVEFKTYNQCTEQNLRIAYYISSFLSQKPIRIACNGGVEISTKELVCDDEFAERAQKKLPVTIVSTDTDKKVFKLNEKTFVVPYTHSVYSPCVVQKIRKGRKGMIAADLKYEGDCYQIYFSSQPANEFFPGVKEFKEVDELLTNTP